MAAIVRKPLRDGTLRQSATGPGHADGQPLTGVTIRFVSLEQLFEYLACETLEAIDRLRTTVSSNRQPSELGAKW
jgi:hypothetical protein